MSHLSQRLYRRLSLLLFLLRSNLVRLLGTLLRPQDPSDPCCRLVGGSGIVVPSEVSPISTSPHSVGHPPEPWNAGSPCPVLSFRSWAVSAGTRLSSPVHSWFPVELCCGCHFAAAETGVDWCSLAWDWSLSSPLTFAVGRCASSQ